MKPLFLDITKCAELKEELERWRGTPFIGHCALRGVGVDCVRLAASVLQSIGAMGPIDWPSYPINGGNEDIRKMLCDRIEAAGPVPVTLAENETPMMGDLLVFSSNRFHHVGLMGENGYFWHCLRGIGVSENLLADSTFSERLYKVFRILTPEDQA